MRRVLLAAALLLAVAADAAPSTYAPDLNARVFDRAWRLVAHKFWDRARAGAPWEAARARFRARAIAAPDRRAFYTVLGEMLAGLGDSHVYAIDPVQVRIGRDRAAGRAAQGFGLELLPDPDGIWRVSTVRAQGPAARSGVALGWALEAVDGQPFDIDFQPAPGTTARFAFRDEDGGRHLLPLAAELEEPLPVRRARRLPGNILLLALDGFDRGDDRWLAERLAEVPGPTAVILDLRGNGGGDAEVIARVAGRFFAEDRPLVRRVGRRTTVQDVKGAGAAAWTGPLAVLVGPESASGAEALAALVDESGRGVIVGQRTAGALTGASDYRLPDGGVLTVAEFDLRTPSGTRLEGVGLAPRVAVAPTLAERRAGRDPVLDRAVATLAAHHQGEGGAGPGEAQ